MAMPAESYPRYSSRRRPLKSASNTALMSRAQHGAGGPASAPPRDTEAAINTHGTCRPTRLRMDLPLSDKVSGTVAARATAANDKLATPRGTAAHAAARRARRWHAAGAAEATLPHMTTAAVATPACRCTDTADRATRASARGHSCDTTDACGRLERQWARCTRSSEGAVRARDVRTGRTDNVPRVVLWRAYPRRLVLCTQPAPTCACVECDTSERQGAERTAAVTLMV
eukprot:363291-Chlamydomonas_euryale.AAC.16